MQNCLALSLALLFGSFLLGVRSIWHVLVQQRYEARHFCSATWRRCMTEESQVKRIEVVHKTPVMFYRPNQPSGGNYLKVPVSYHIEV